MAALNLTRKMIINVHLTGRISEMLKESEFRATAVHTCTERVHTGREAIDEPTG